MAKQLFPNEDPIGKKLVSRHGALVDQSVADRQLTMWLLAVCAGLALLLATIGVYSLMEYSATQRSGEIGMCMALGARAGDVQTMVIRQGMKLTGVGVAIGLAAALAFSRLVQALHHN